MCFCFNCFCNCCNSFSSICVEITILILSIIQFMLSLLDIIIIKWNHIKTSPFVLLIMLILFSSIIILCSLSIIMSRIRRVINKKRNGLSACLARLGLLLSVTSLFIAIASETMVQQNFDEINYPCKTVNYNNYNNNLYLRYLRLLSSDDEFCKDKYNDYNAQICSSLEYTVSYLSATIIEIISILLIFLWFNDLRRIKEKVNGSLNLYGDGFINKDIVVEKKGYNFGNNNNEQQVNEANSLNKLNQNQPNSSHIILTKNQKNRRHTVNANRIRFSKSNFNFPKNKDKKSYIKNIGQDIKKGIETIDEEEDSHDNKEKDKEKSKQNDRKISIFKNNKKDNIYKKKHYDTKNMTKIIENIEKEDSNNTNIEENKENIVEKPDIYIKKKG